MVGKRIAFETSLLGGLSLEREDPTRKDWNLSDRK